MPVRITNTLTGQKEDLQVIDGNNIGMYVCGPTVYDNCHIGHARAYVTFDMIRRYLVFRGYSVNYVQNFTDVDDKIINRAKEIGEDPLKLSERFIAAYFEDMDSLNVMRADIHPTVSGHILDIIEFVSELIEKGNAYESQGDVYFEVKSFEGYGKLSGQNLDSIQAVARVSPTDKKKNPEDFALWKAAKEGEISWESPWGPGRPGWHIECSVMSTKYLGETFDIHGGGMDLIFPHHENELAQAQAKNGPDTFARNWLHNGFITVRKEKMSKSLGNFTTLRDLFEKYDPLVLRFYLLLTHYKSPIDFDLQPLEEAGDNYRKILDSLEKLGQCAGSGADGVDARLKELSDSFISAMNDDFNTRVGITEIMDGVKWANRSFDTLSEAQGRKVKGTLSELMDVLGLMPAADGGEDSVLVDNLVKLLIELRKEARERKDWAMSDAVRDRLKAIGVVLEDGKAGTTYKIER